MEITRIFDILENYRTHAVKEKALNFKENKTWKCMSSEEYVSMSTSFSYGLLSLGLKKGDTIVTISNNRPEWNIIDMGMAQCGIVHTPIYATMSQEETKFIFEHSEAKMIIVSDAGLYEKARGIIQDMKTKPEIYTINKLKGIANYSEIMEKGDKNEKKISIQLEAIKQSIKPDDTFTIIYTSGTTGLPKGVMLSHRNLISNVESCVRLFPVIDENLRALSFLPICHVFERMVNYVLQYCRSSIYYAENLGTVASDLKEVKANLFTAVPRVIERFYDRIIGKGNDLEGAKKSIFFWAVKLGLQYNVEKKNSLLYNAKLKVARKLVFSKWQKALGGNLKFIVSGGAALQPRLCRIFWAAGIKVVEGYGLTETSPVIAANHFLQPGNTMPGTVGTVMENLDVKILDDGEIIVKGPSVMKGYYKDEEATNEVMEKDGWFHTGDVGQFVNKKFLKITDRKKEIFKNSSGKYIAPQVIENKLKESIMIEQIMVIGENQKFASALISPNFEFLHTWCEEHKIHFRDNCELVEKPAMQKLFKEEVNRVNENLGQVERIKRFRLVCDPWTTETGILSPTLKLKRKVIAEKYKKLIDEIYFIEASE